MKANESLMVLKKDQLQKTTFQVGNIEIGKDFFVIAGPCSVESEEQIIDIAKHVKACGASILRGGVYKPRTSPYSFQGLGEIGFQYLKEAKEITGLPIITEVLDIQELSKVVNYVDIIQVGTRNAQNYSLLKELGRIDKPVLLKRGYSCTLMEFLYCAEYILNNGNNKVILCERGIRGVGTADSVFDINAIPLIKSLSHLPIIADPSHGTGNREIVIPISLSAIVAGADGLMVEVHNNPHNALSDAKQQMDFDEFQQMMMKTKLIAKFCSEQLHLYEDC